MIVGFNLVAANEPVLPVAESGGPLGSILPGVQGWALGDRGYWKAGTARDLAARGLSLLAPYKDKKRKRQAWPHWLIGKRRRIETVLGQLVERYRVKRIWARDAWHLWSRWLRCVLSHTIAVLLCQQRGLSPLQFDHLLTDCYLHIALLSWIQAAIGCVVGSPTSRRKPWQARQASCLVTIPASPRSADTTKGGDGS